MVIIIRKRPYDAIGIIISERLSNATHALRVARIMSHHIGCTAARPHISYAKQQLRITDSMLRQVTNGRSHGQY